MIRFASQTADINGKFGGVRYRRDNCGLHMEKEPEHRPPWSYKRKPQNEWFQKCMVAWKQHDWLDVEISLWYQWCQKHPKHNKKGEPYHLHPFLGFMSVNIQLLRDGLKIEYVPLPWW